MARISLKNVMIEYQVNQRDEYGDAVDIDHIPVFAGKTDFAPSCTDCPRDL